MATMLLRWQSAMHCERAQARNWYESCTCLLRGTLQGTESPCTTRELPDFSAPLSAMQRALQHDEQENQLWKGRTHKPPIWSVN